MAAAPGSGQIAFIRATGAEDAHVCLLELDSGQVSTLDQSPCVGAPVWSPDGAWLAFETTEGNGTSLRVVRGDGSEARTVGGAHGWSGWPSWSADGTSLAYVAAADSGSEILVYDMASGTETRWGTGNAALMSPVWMAPDMLMAIGVVGAEDTVATDIFLVTREDATRLPGDVLAPDNPYVEWRLASNPRHAAIAFESNDGGDREIFVLSLKRKGLMDVSNHRAADWNPVWTPDGRALAFESFRGGRRGIYKGFPDRTRVLPIAVDADSDNWHPSWSPDGQWIAHVSTRTGDNELFVTSANGDTSKRLTEHPGPDYAPAWRPGDRQ